MPVTIEDVLQANMILVGINLINTPEELTAFRGDVGTEVVTAETGFGNEIVERTLTLNRDRIRVMWASDRSAIVREYPAASDIERFAQVAGMAIRNTGLDDQELRAFGYNIELAYEPDSKELATKYLSDRLFMPLLLRDEGWQLTGGAGRLSFEKDGRLWQVRLEPRLNDDTTTRIFASVNLHQAEADLSFPSESEIRDCLRLLWCEAHNLVNQLDGSTT